MGFVLLLVPLLAACSTEPPAARPPPAVGVVTAHFEDVGREADFRGRVQAARTAEVRARVTGIVLEREFEEGQQVEAGDPLFRIDARPMNAALARARAQVEAAEADLRLARLTADRLAPLAGTRAVSAQRHDEATANVQAAEAALALAKANVTTAGLDVEFSRVTAPITGRIGAAQVTEGALVTAGTNTQMATIVQMDPIFVDLTVPVDQLRAYRQAVRDGRLERRGASEVALFLSDGWTYPHRGTLAFTDVTVDPATGSTLVRASFPNPDNDLFPGMYVRARISGGVTERGVLAPMQAVSRGSDGPTVRIVEDGVVRVRPVELGGEHGDRIVVTHGLNEGDHLVVDGLQRASEGAAVSEVEWVASRSEPTVHAESGAH